MIGARGRSADTHAHHRRFGDGHVAYPFGPELLEQAIELPIRASESADILAQYQNIGIVAHFLADGARDRFPKKHLLHCSHGLR